MQNKGIFWFLLPFLVFCAGFSQNVTLSQNEIDSGFTLLFDGTLQGLREHWVNYRRGDDNNTDLSSRYRVEDDDGYYFWENGGSDIRTKRKYGDFEMRFEYRCNGNSGLFYRFNVDLPSAWETGVEWAIDDRSDISEYSPGGAYDLYEPYTSNWFMFNTGKWNSARLICNKDSVEHWQNGEFMLGYRYWNSGFETHYDNSKWTSFPCFAVKICGDNGSGYIEEGYIGWQGSYGGDQYIRNIRIAELPYDVAQTSGCMDPASPNHNAAATVDDGSCTYSGCKNDPGAPNYYCTLHPTCFPCAGTNGYTLANITDDGSCATSIAVRPAGGDGIVVSPEVVSILVPSVHTVEFLDVSGRRIYMVKGDGAVNYSIDDMIREPGLYYLKVTTPEGTVNRRILLY